MRTTAQTLEIFRIRLKLARLAAVIGRKLDPTNTEALRVNAASAVELIQGVLNPETMRWLKTMPGGIPADEWADVVVEAVSRIRARGADALSPSPEAPDV